MLALTIVEIFLALILVIPWFLVLYDAIRWAAPVWRGARKNKVIWIVFILLLPPIGVLGYLIVARPELVSEGGAPGGPSLPRAQGEVVDDANPLLLMRRNTVVAIGLLLAAIALAGVLGVWQIWRLA